MNTDNPQVLDLAAVATMTLEQVDQRGLVAALALGGAIGALLARPGDTGARAWTLEAAAEHHGLSLADGLACFAIHRGVLEAWSLHAADLRLAELRSVQLELGAGALAVVDL